MSFKPTDPDQDTSYDSKKYKPLATTKVFGGGLPPSLVDGGTLGGMAESDGTEGYLDVPCKPCGHSWTEHDDLGCLWRLCRCGLPGERK